MPSEARERQTMTALAWLAAISVLVVPLAINRDLLDRYRVLKESLFRAEGFLGAFVLVAAVALAGSRRLREMVRHRAVVAVTAAGLAWGVVVTAVSTHPAHSHESLVTVAASVLVFGVVWYAAPRIPLLILDLLVPVTLANVVLVTLQEYGVWNPLHFADPLLTRHLKATGLIDNPNVVGSYMALLAVIFAAAMHVRGWRRILYAVGALTATAGVLVSQTRTALVALAAGVLVLAIAGSMRRAVVVMVALAVIFGAAVMWRVPAVMAVIELPRRLAEGNLEVTTSGRVAPVLAGLAMVQDRPLTGVGPGAFKYHYMTYKWRVMERNPDILRGTTGTNFAEVHNDHVQLLAETGIPGYALFLLTVAIIVRTALRGNGGDPRQNIARWMALPLAVTLLVLALAQFPLYVAVTRQLLVTFAGLMVGWSRPWE